MKYNSFLLCQINKQNYQTSSLKPHSVQLISLWKILFTVVIKAHIYVYL